MRITPRGQVTIPADIREKSGLLPHTEVEFQYDGEVIRVVPSTKRRENDRGWRIVEALRGKGDLKMTTDEIMAMTRGED